MPDHEKRKKNRCKRDRIEIIDCMLPAPGNDKSAQRRAKNGTKLEGGKRHAEGVGQVLLGHEVGHQRLTGWSIKGHRDGLQCSDAVNVPDGDMPKLSEQSKG